MMTNWSDTKSVYSISSKSDASTLAISRTRAKNAPLHERCSIFDMVKIKEAFQAANKGKLLSTGFREMLRTVLNVEYDDEEYKLLFLKINTSRNGEVDWDEFVSHLILGYFGNDPENQRGTLELPILGLPTILRSQHRHPISRILFLPAVSKERTVDPLQGSYMTVSRDGMINWWTLGMHLQRTAYSSSPHLKVKSTWVTDMVVLPDVNIVVTSSTERDLRFYDCAAGTFTLKIVIYSWEYMICSMCYHFTQDENEPCKLILGDVGGYIRLLTFSPIMRGPFQNQAGKVLVQLRHKDLKRKTNPLPGLQLTEYRRAHAEWIRQVAFYSSLSYIVTCATCPDSLLMCDLTGGNKTYNMFHVEKGIQCFAFDEEVHVLATGGPDCTVRIWNPFVPTKPSVTFQGHHAGIMSLVIQEHGRRVYSLSRDRVIKVWDVQGQACIQTYIDIPAVIGERTPITAVYNQATREYILAAMMIAVLVLDEQLNPLHTDGFTHSKAVSKVLYNPLFKVVVTCGLDSIIINWDPITGKRNMMVRDAHTRLLHGELIPVEITAATFDPGFQLLLTGARNGTLRVWNFNTGVCLRNMSIEHMCEVTGVFWVDGRILAIGWNRHVTEFDDSGTSERGKSWEVRHTDDVLAAAARPPLAIVTGSYNSELLMWKLETGQPYRQFSCTDPMLRIKMHYSKKDLARATASQDKTEKDKSTAAIRRRSSTSGLKRPSMVQRESSIEPSEAIAKARARKVSTVALPGDLRSMRRLAIHAMLFLETRPQTSQDCSLLVALENGRIQCWSDHPAGGYKGSFQGVHTAGDYVSAMATDVNNDYVFTGTTVGYVKVWLMTNFLTTLEPVHISMPKLRLQFPFLWYDRIEGRAKRCVRDQPLPLLLNSYRAHLRCITSVAYVDEHKLVLSGSSDYSVRLWRLSGEYLQTLGSFVPWTLEVTRFPPDVKKVASFTTFKVWKHGDISRYTPGQVEVDKLKDITEKELKTKTFGAPPEEPLLGHYFQLPRRPDRQDPIKLDDALPTIPIYAHLRMASTQPVKRPPTPELVKATRLRQTVQARRTHFDPNRPSVVDQVPPPEPDKEKDEKEEGPREPRESAKKSS